MRIWLDDQLDDPQPELVARHTPAGWVGAKTTDDFKKIITEAKERNEQIEALDLDNDLGGDDEGYRVLEWLKEFWPEVLLEADIRVHSQNSVRREWMEKFIENCREHPEEVLDFKNRPSYEELFGADQNNNQ